MVARPVRPSVWWCRAAAHRHCFDSVFGYFSHIFHIFSFYGGFYHVPHSCLGSGQLLEGRGRSSEVVRPAIAVYFGHFQPSAAYLTLSFNVKMSVSDVFRRQYHEIYPILELGQPSQCSGRSNGVVQAMFHVKNTKNTSCNPPYLHRQRGASPPSYLFAAFHRVYLSPDVFCAQA